MQSTSKQPDFFQPSDALSVREHAPSRGKRSLWVGYICWLCALLVFIFSCIFMSFHHSYFPLDLTTTKDVQHLAIPAWLNAILNFPSRLNDPVPALIALILWVVFLALAGLIAHLRGKSPRVWWLAAVFLALIVQVSAGLNVVIDELVKRKRPLPGDGIHVVGSIVPFPTYPSGHTEHDVVYYGFLLYLSFSKSVRNWRFRWLLIPLQLYALFDILAIGFSRIELGDHWLTDVLGGYLEGAIYLCFFIFLYHRADRALREQQAKKAAQQSADAA